uniref:Olfactory receptor n=1 Tax=Gopherus evgoodei TaxID=1825980 RepID=A0A8C4WRH0_9SAUR
MSNQTTVTEFLLLGFSDIRELQILHFMVFLLLYLISLLGNLLIITAIALDHHLHIPMYFFLMNLSILDLGFISVTIPKSMANSLMNTRSISYSGCVTQIFLVVVFVSAGFAILTVMAYDRYVAICQPLHYEIVMNRRACVQMAASAWISGILYSALHTRNTFAMSFCGGNMVDQFFCEIPQILKLACSDSYHFEVRFLIFSMCLASSCFVSIIVSYVQIFKAVMITLVSFILVSLDSPCPFLLTVTSYVCIIATILRIPSTTGRQKAFSTCSSHLIVVTLFYGTLMTVYLLPKSNTLKALNKVFSVFYTVLTPMLNPLIYSLRNKEVKETLRKVIR